MGALAISSFRIVTAMALPAYIKSLSFSRANTTLVSLLVSALSCMLWTICDYHLWVSRGTGGTPSTWTGYFEMTTIQIQYKFSAENLVDPGCLSTDGPSFLPTTLPHRARGRPQMMPHILPQRQRREPIDPASERRLHSLAAKLAAERPELLQAKLSRREGCTTSGLYARKNLTTLNRLALDERLEGEIAHTHLEDSSLHVFMSDRDARKVIEANWGQRFPPLNFPSGWIMVYAPMNNTEVDIVEQIVRAAATWITGIGILEGN